jgi:hypothetical protein
MDPGPLLALAGRIPDEFAELIHDTRLSCPGLFEPSPDGHARRRELAAPVRRRIEALRSLPGKGSA